MEVDTRWVLRWVLCPALPACPSQTLPAYTLPSSGCSLISSSPFHTPRASPSSSDQPGWLEQPTCPQQFATGAGEIWGADGKQAAR